MEGLRIRPDGIYVDATTGGGGHSLRIAEQLSEQGRLICFDRDREALAALGDSLHGDEGSVCKAISLVIYQLAKCLEETDRVRQQEEKRTAALCFSAALLMVILLT